MENNLISIVVTCYNLEDEIGRCLDSLCRQTYQNLQIIVVDDGSQDQSFARIQEAARKDRRIVAVYQENAGPSSARNHGIRLATGEFLMFIDGDDYVADTYVEHFAEVSEGCDLVIGGQCSICDGHVEFAMQENSFRCTKEEYKKTYFLDSIRKRSIFGPVIKLYRMSVIRQHQICFDETVSIHEDALFVIDFLQHVHIVSGISYAEYYYVQHHIGTSLVSKFHENELAVNHRYFEMVFAFLGEEASTKPAIRCLNKTFLNIDISTIRKFYNSDRYSLIGGLRYIHRLTANPLFRRMRRQLLRADPRAVMKFYRPVLVSHAINYLAIKMKR